MFIDCHSSDHGCEKSQYEGIQENDIPDRRPRTESRYSPSSPKEDGSRYQFFVESPIFFPGKIPFFIKERLCLAFQEKMSDKGDTYGPHHNKYEGGVPGSRYIEKADDPLGRKHIGESESESEKYSGSEADGRFCVSH